MLKKYIKNESLEGEGSFEMIESISAGRDSFQQRLQDEIINLIHAGEICEKHAIELADDLAESFSEQYDQL